MTYLLKDWSLACKIAIHGGKPLAVDCTAAEANCIKGKAHGRPGHEDGDSIVTSWPLQGRKGNDIIVTRSGSEYKLENVSPSYQIKFPGEAEAFLASIAELNA